MFWSGWYKKSWGRWINRLKDKALSKSFSNISKKFRQHFSKIYPLMYQSMAEGHKSQPAGLAKDSARRDELFASSF